MAHMTARISPCRPQILLLLGIWVTWDRSTAADRVFLVVTNSALVSHWPGPDEYLGTTDDVVQNRPSQILESSLNSVGSYAYLATSLAGLQDTWLPAGADTATFLQGTITIDTAAPSQDNIPLLKSLEFQGTPLFPGHGLYSLRLTPPHDGHYTQQGPAYGFTTLFDFEGTFIAGLARATNAHATGSVYLIESRDFAVDLPNPGNFDSLKRWIHQVALPLARTRQPTAILCGRVEASTTGSIAGTPGYFPPLAAFGTFLAEEPSPTEVAKLRITDIRVVLGGIRLEWSNQPGKTYRIDSATSVTGPCQTQARIGSETQFLDLSVAEASQRFYRIVAE